MYASFSFCLPFVNHYTFLYRTQIFIWLSLPLLFSVYNSHFLGICPAMVVLPTVKGGGVSHLLKEVCFSNMLPLLSVRRVVY